jgi:DNA-binding LacI/PurR family transcriptional regulator
MKDIADQLGISRASVSYVLNRSKRMRLMSPETVSRIQQAAVELGYKPNEIARAMKTGATRTIGFITHALNWESNVLVLHGATEEAFTENYYIKYVPACEEKDSPEDIARHCIEQKLAGVICMNINYTFLKQMYKVFNSVNMPLAQVVNGFSDLGHVLVTADDTMGTRIMVDHLAGLGHRQIAMMTNSREQSSSVNRIQGFETAMRNKGLPIPRGYIREGKFDPEIIATETRTLLKLKKRPTAIFCDNDPTAMSVINTLRQEGLRVPEDISVGGYVNLAVCRFFDPPITTVAHPFNELGQAVAKELIRDIEKCPSKRLRTVCLPTCLIERASTAPAKQ